jgi:Phosphodiester glycosidase
MSPTPLPLRRLLARRAVKLERTRVPLPDGSRTTLHVATYDRDAFRPRVAVLEQPIPLARWCRENGVRHALVGGFFLRPSYEPLGEVRIDGALQPSAPFDAPWDSIRACVQVAGGSLRIARRDALEPQPAGDLLQAGPLLVTEGQPLALSDDAEGFSAGARQFDSDITRGRYPRAALGIDDERLVTVTCDGRTRRDSGLTLSELAHVMADLGVHDALNLDGGGSASLVYQGRLRNRPREEHGVDILGGRPVVTAVILEHVGPPRTRSTIG